jgi:hypothetical protein
LFYDSSIQHRVKHPAVNTGVKSIAHAQNTTMTAENISGFLELVLVYHLHFILDTKYQHLLIFAGIMSQIP